MSLICQYQKHFIAALSMHCCTSETALLAAAPEMWFRFALHNKECQYRLRNVHSCFCVLCFRYRGSFFVRFDHRYTRLQKRNSDISDLQTGYGLLDLESRGDEFALFSGSHHFVVARCFSVRSMRSGLRDGAWYLA
jgi:hypothetical protein